MKKSYISFNLAWKIIEIESSLNPKKIIGIIVATHLSNHLKAKEIIANLESVNMEIIYKEPKNLSSKKQQLALIETSLDKIMEKVPGCLSGFKFTGNA